jgi:PAS domain S-box-containing protein
MASMSKGVVAASPARVAQAGWSPAAAFVPLAFFSSAVWFGSQFLMSAKFLPHWFCYVGDRRLVWTNVLSDFTIGLSYVIISATLVWLVRRAGRDLPYHRFFWAFGVFIVSCGVTHFMEVVTIWKPVYWISAAVKIVTALASAATSVVLLIAADDIVAFVRTAQEAASRRGTERFRALVQAAPMAVIGMDLAGSVNAWNPAAERIFGWRAEEVVGKKITALPAENENEVSDICRRISGGEIVAGFETARITRTGRQIPVSISGAPIYDENGSLISLMLVAEDISERKRIELELQERTKEQAQLESQMRQAQKMEVLGRLAGGVAHDFNNMLMVLDGCSDLLDRALPPESPARLYLNQIQRTTEKAAAITKQLLAFSRKQILEMKPMDLHEALTSSEFMLPRLLGSDIELSFHHEARRSWIVCDASQIEQVIANLAINSRDAMPKGGRLTIATTNAAGLPDAAAAAAPSAASVHDWVVLSVTDSGCGMDEKTRAQIFEPFFTTKPLGKGTGLGLATVYGIVKQSNGHIHVRTTPGQGTTFEIYFPSVDPVLPSVPPPDESTTTPDLAAATILVADDESALRHAVVELLRASGYTVFEADNALEALELAEKHPGIDILLTDIVMPGFRGPELARRISAVQPGISVIYMSGYAEGFQENELPPNAMFLQKPFRFSKLLEQLKLIRGGADQAE